MLKQIFLIAGLLTLTGCSTGYSYLALTPAEPVTENPARPQDIPTATSALADCSGVQLNEALIHLACDDAQEVYAARYDAEVEPESCQGIASDVYRGSNLVGGPALQLPDPSLTYRADIEASTGMGAVSAVVSCSPAPQGGLLFLTAIGRLQLDRAFYERALPAIAYDGVPASIVGSRRPDSLNFLGRALPVHPSCSLMGARNLSCYPSGQMDWSEFNSLADAQAASERRVQASVSAGATVLEDESVECEFEGVATSCRRVVFRLPISRILTLGASNVLIAYYVAEEVRGQNAQAVCSFYDDQAPEGGLAALCAESFELPQ